MMFGTNVCGLRSYSGNAFELDRSDVAAFAPALAVIPRPEHQVRL
jgi:hypothetical protein